MPNNVPPELEEKFRSCKEKVMADGNDEESAYGICYAAIVEGKADAASLAGKAGFIFGEATKYLKVHAVKAVGDWELEVKVLPFTTDSDGQWFDENTDIMQDAFSTPLVIYQHGIKQGAKQIDNKPVIVGKSVQGTLQKRNDGWYIKVILDKALKQAKDIMEAAWKGLVAVSSDSIAHLARLDIGGKLIPYEKNKPGRIAVWPLAGFSLWEKGNGNFSPANHSAFALPAMKAIYREAGLPFPDITDDVLPEAKQKAVKRARQVIEQSKKVIKQTEKFYRSK